MLCHQPSGAAMNRSARSLPSTESAAHASERASPRCDRHRVLTCELSDSLLSYSEVNHTWEKRLVCGISECFKKNKKKHTCSLVVMLSHSAMSWGIISACFLRFSSSWGEEKNTQESQNSSSPHSMHPNHQDITCLMSSFRSSHHLLTVRRSFVVCKTKNISGASQ